MHVGQQGLHMENFASMENNLSADANVQRQYSCRSLYPPETACRLHEPSALGLIKVVIDDGTTTSTERAEQKLLEAGGVMDGGHPRANRNTYNCK